jgi:hypothetical protein
MTAGRGIESRLVSRLKMQVTDASFEGRLDAFDGEDVEKGGVVVARVVEAEVLHVVGEPLVQPQTGINVMILKTFLPKNWPKIVALFNKKQLIMQKK